MYRPFGVDDLLFILNACGWTLLLSGIAFLGGTLVGAIVAAARISRIALLRNVSLGYVRVIQGTPSLLQIFLIFFGIALTGVDVPPLLAASVALAINAGALLGEIWKGSILNVPRGQWEAASALGLTPAQAMLQVILPQALRVAVAPTVGILVQVIKGTSLASLIGFVELSRAGQMINSSTFAPTLVFGFVAACYFCICWPLTVLSRKLEVRLSRGF